VATGILVKPWVCGGEVREKYPLSYQLKFLKLKVSTVINISTLNFPSLFHCMGGCGGAFG